MKIAQADIKNFKRLKTVSFSPAGEIIVVGGRNAQGKSSVLDAIEVALGGTRSAPSAPIRKGTDKAEIVVKTDDGYTITRTFTEAGSALTIKTREGHTLNSPQAMLDKALAPLLFDPLAFTRQKPKDRLEAMKVALGVDTAQLDYQRKEFYDERTMVNRELDQMKASLGGKNFHDDVPETEVSISALSESLSSATAHNAKIASAQNAAEGFKVALQSALNRVARLEAELAEAKEDAVTCQKGFDDANERAAAMKPIDTRNLEEQIRTAEDTNRKVRENDILAAAMDRWEKTESRRVELNQLMDKIDADKAEMIRSAKFPVPGVSLGEDDVLLNGLPFDQASTAEQIKVTAAIALASNPKMRLLLIREGSLLDEDSLAALEQFAIDNDAQVLIERVGSEGASFVIEDGQVAGVQPELSEALL